MKTIYHGNAHNFPIKFGKEIIELPNKSWSFMGGNHIINGDTRQTMYEYLRSLDVTYVSHFRFTDVGIYTTRTVACDTYHYWDSKGREIAFGDRTMSIQLYSRIWGDSALRGHWFDPF